jgi:Transposase IS66 family
MPALTAEAIDYTLNHWPTLTRCRVPIDNSQLERQINPCEMVRS